MQYSQNHNQYLASTKNVHGKIWNDQLLLNAQNLLYDYKYLFFGDTPELFKNVENILKEDKTLEIMNLFYKKCETWETHRKQLLEEMEQIANSIENLTETTSLGKLILSTASIFGSAAFLTTDYLNMKSNWKMKLLTVSGLIGSLSFISDVILQYYRKSKVEKIIHLFLVDQDNFEALNSDKQKKFFFEFIEKIFPHGINDDILNEILTSPGEMSIKLHFKIKELEQGYQNLKSMSHKKFRLNGRSHSIPIINSNLQIRFNNFNNKLSHHRTMKPLKMLEMDEVMYCKKAKNTEEKIFNVIYFSNVYKQHDLFQDAKLIENVKIFSKSTFANFWWKNLENQKSTKQAEKKKLYSEIKSVLKEDRLFWPAMSVAALPLSSNYTANAIAIFVTSSIIAFDAFCELSIKIQPKETSILKRVHRILSSEYEDLKLNSEHCTESQ